METVIVICVLVVMAPLIILSLNSAHLTRSLADFISGKRAGAKELQELKERLKGLEGELSEMREKFVSLEEANDFSMKLLEDLKNKKKPD